MYGEADVGKQRKAKVSLEKDDKFFRCVIGPMVEVGDHVATNAIYQPNMPIKWSAEKVWRVQDSHSRLREKDDECWMTSSKTKSPKSRTEVGIAEGNRSVDGRHRTHKPGILDRKRQNTSRSPATEQKIESVSKRRRESLKDANSKDIDYDSTSIRLLHDVKLFNKKELVVPDFQRHFQKVLPPVHLYRINCHWQDSFPLLKPFQPLKNTVFQILEPTSDVLQCCALPPSDGYSVNVLFLSMPSTAILQEKVSSRLLDGDDHVRRSLQKYIKVLAFKRSDDSYKAIGGSWDMEKDGTDPSSNPKTLINTAVRCCKEQLGLDLSLCTHWHRFMEFRYSRTEGLTARPPSVLFPGTQLWGHAGFSEGDQAATGSSNAGGGTTAAYKPFHRIVVYLLPDLTSLVPSDEDWPDVKAACEHQLNFPDKAKDEVEEEGEEGHRQNSVDSPTVDTNPRRTQIPPNSTVPSDETGRTLQSTASIEQNSSAASLGTMEEHKATVIDGTTTTESSSITIKSDHEDGTTVIKLHGEFNPLSMKVSELREQLKIRNLPADGIRAQLIARLKVAVEKEAEEAKKAEDERKQRQKENEETVLTPAKVDCKIQSTEKQPSIAKVSTDQPKSDEVKKVTLRNIPSIIIHQLRHMVYSVSMETVLDQKPDQMNSEVYEFIFCLKSFLDMLRRDATFTLFRALVSAADRGVQAKPTQRSTSTARSESSVHQKQRGGLVPNSKSTKPTSIGALGSATTSRIVDVPLLYACSLFDTTSRGYFHMADVEDLIFSLALPVSRYQVRSLLTKVSYHQRIYYRTLTDAGSITSVATGSGKLPTALYSDIDDDEYLLELVRGGDAILDDQQEEEASVGSILLLRSITDGRDGKGDTVSEITAPAPEEFVRQLRRSELENIRLMTRIQSQAKELENMTSLRKRISVLEKKLASTGALLDDHRLRARRERDRVRAVSHSLEKQVYSLDMCRNAIVQATERLRVSQRSGSDSSPSRETSLTAKARPPRDDGQSGGAGKPTCAGESSEAMVSSLTEESVAVAATHAAAAAADPTVTYADTQPGGGEQVGKHSEGTKSHVEEETNDVDAAPPSCLAIELEAEVSMGGSVDQSNEQEKSGNTSTGSPEVNAES